MINTMKYVVLKSVHSLEYRFIEQSSASELLQNAQIKLVFGALATKL